jgi:conjugal transfer ATP-binding protein TraC
MIGVLQALKEKVAHFFQDEGEMSDSYLNNHQQFLQTFGLEKLLPYRSFKKGSTLFFQENSTGFVIETYALVGSTEEMQRELQGFLQSGLKEGSCLQVMLFADPRIDGVLDEWSKGFEKRGEIFSQIAEKRKEHLRHLVDQGRDVVPRHFRVIISYSEPGICQTPLEEEAIRRVQEHLKAALETLGMPLHLWNAQDLIQFLDGIINFCNSTALSPLGWNPNTFINEQISRPDTQWHISSEGIHLQEKKYIIRTYGVLREPDYWSLNAMSCLLGDLYRDALRLGVPFFLNYGMTLCEQNKVQMLIQSRQDWVEKQSFTKIGKRIPSIKAQSKELHFLREHGEKGDRFIRSRFSVTLLSPIEPIETQESILKSLFRSHRWELVREKYLQLPMLLSTLPMSWAEGMHQDLGYFKRLKTTLTSEAANLLPLQGEWRGNSSQGMIFVGRRGQIFVWDPFTTCEGNYNISVVGRSGSGKSVFMQELVTMAVAGGAQVVIIDVGRSFEKLVKLLGGVYIEFTPHTPLCLNPFSSIASNAMTQESLALLKPIISLMAAPQEGTNDLENALIEQALMNTWQKKQNQAGMDDVIQSLLEMDDPLAKALGKKLFPYSKEGAYGRYFNGPSTLDLHHPMVVLELEELKERKDLQSVIVQVMILHVTSKLYLGNRRQRTYLVLDEAWDLLRSSQGGTFIETAARRFRKYQGSLVVGTQSIHDFYATPGAQAAFDNSDWLCMLSQKPESIENLKKSNRIIVDPMMEELLHSLKTKSGSYGEVMIRGNHGFSVGRLILDPFSNMLYSTKAEEFSHIQTRIQGGATLYEALLAEAKQAA